MIDINTLITIFIFFVFHFIGDFPLQLEELAKNKSKSNIALFKHVLIYSLTMMLPAAYYVSPEHAIYFMLFIFITHFITDYLTSRMTSKQYKLGNYYGLNGFFTIIGFDQLMHTAQILIGIKLYILPCI
jgi:hypothetical protein